MSRCTEANRTFLNPGWQRGRERRAPGPWHPGKL